jgi:hypothetical protein
MKTLPKAKSLSKESLRCSKCGTPIPQIVRIGRIKPDIDVVDLFKGIKRHLKETNKLLKRASFLLNKTMFEATFME